jgi:hypothetical protein
MSGDEALEALNDTIAAAVQDYFASTSRPGSLPSRWALIAEIVEPSGERTLLRSSPKTMSWWETSGLYLAGHNLTRPRA